MIDTHSCHPILVVEKVGLNFHHADVGIGDLCAPDDWVDDGD